MIKVYGVYDKQGFLVDLEDWTDEASASLIASTLGTKLHTCMVRPYNWRPRIPRSL